MGPGLSGCDRAALLGFRRLHAALQSDLRDAAMGWEDILGLIVTFGLLWYLLWAMLRAEKV